MVEGGLKCPAQCTAAVIFPGQGSQSPDMLTAYTSHPVVAQTVDEAAAAIDADLPALISNKPELDQTINTQPALLAVCVGVFRAAHFAQSTSPHLPDMPVLLAGHSLGEYAALVCGGALPFADAVRLVRRRGELMQETSSGGMAAIIGAAAAVDECCAQARDNGASIWAANYNSPQQTVVAGDAAAIQECLQWTSHSGIKKVVPLTMSIPSHCPLMSPAADAFAGELKKIKWQLPSSPVVHNATLKTASSSDEIISALAAQLVSPVRWTEIVKQLAAAATRIYECGPGGVLCGLAKRIPEAPEHISLAASDNFQSLCPRCGIPQAPLECCVT